VYHTVSIVLNIAISGTRKRKRAVAGISSDEADSENESYEVPPPPTSHSASRTSEERSPAIIKLPDLMYVPDDAELVEDGTLEIHGETVPEDDDSDSDDVPIRVLKNFVVFEVSDDNRLARFHRGLCDDKSRTFAAAGVVEPYIDSDGNSSESSDGSYVEQRVRLSEIKEVSVHVVSDERYFDLDP
jgi:hypothetical protein